MTAVEPRAGRRKALRLLGWVAGSLAVIAVLAMIAVVFLLPAAAGGTARSVRSGSMAPALPTGSLVIDRPVAPAALHIGDIATYRATIDGTTRYVTHRVVGISGPAARLRFTFRGDANRSADPRPVPASAIRGKVWFSVPFVGAITDRLTAARWVIIGLAVLGLGCYSAWQIAGGLRRPAAEEA